MEAKGKRIAYPWGSKRVSLTQLRQLAQALELPITGGNADLQVIVEGKLREMERDPSSVQVVLKESIVEGQQTILLEDENGTFLETVTPEHSRDPTPTLSEVTSTECITVKDGSQQQGTSSESETEDEQTEDEQLQSGQRELQVQLQIAKNEISVLTDKL